ncbi:MAG: hypothetical protein P3B98_12125 [Gemmatimonadota bacterium]|nr:hypothetical protein [Gemmatimonadota bacterium]
MHLSSISARALSAAALALVVSCAKEPVAPDAAALVSANPAIALARAPLAATSTAAKLASFESFTPGAINGQFDWQSMGGVGNAPPPGTCAVYDHEISNASALIAGIDATEFLGARSLRLSNAVTSGCYGDQTFSYRTANVAGESSARWGTAEFALPGARLDNHFEAEWTVMSVVPFAQQPGLEVVASPARGDDQRMGWLQVADLADGLAISVARWVDAGSLSGATIAPTIIASGLDRRAPHVIKLTMDFVDGPDNDVVRVWVDGTLRNAGPSWERYYALKGIAPPAVNRLMFRTGSDALRGLPGTAAPATRGLGLAFDNLRQSTFAVPSSTDACRNDGWRVARARDGRVFENQGDCIQWVLHASR